jgi:hypothetical protein
MINTVLSAVNNNIRTAAARRGYYSARETAEMLGMPAQTFRDRLHDPAKWRLDELVRTARRLSVSLQWLLEAHDDKII